MTTLLAALLFACGGADDTNDPSNSDTDATDEASPGAAFDGAIDDLAGSTERHGQDVAGAGDRPTIDAFEDDYWGFCQSNWDTMSSCMDAFWTATG